MPLVRKLILVGKTSKGVIVPKSWLDLHEEEAGCTISKVKIIVKKDELIITPLIPKRRARAKEKEPLEDVRAMEDALLKDLRITDEGVLEDLREAEKEVEQFLNRICKEKATKEEKTC